MTNKKCYAAPKLNKTRKDRWTDIKKAKSKHLDILKNHEKNVSSYINILYLRMDENFGKRLNNITINVLVKHNVLVDSNFDLQLFVKYVISCPLSLLFLFVLVCCLAWVSLLLLAKRRLLLI